MNSHYHYQTDLETESQKIDLFKLLKRIDVFSMTIWFNNETHITLKEIEKAVKHHDVMYRPSTGEYDTDSHHEHVKRIAWLVENWSDDYPIELDFGIPELNYNVYNPIMDGHHRIFAAIYLQKLFINANCSGSVKEIEKYLFVEHSRIAG